MIKTRILDTFFKKKTDDRNSREQMENEIVELSRILKSLEHKKADCEEHLRNIELEAKNKEANYIAMENELKSVF